MLKKLAPLQRGFAAFAAGRVIDGLAGLLEIRIPVTPVAGGVLSATLAGKRLGAATRR